MDSTKKKLRKLGVKPVDGQNFLTSEPIINALVAAGEVEDHTVLEIGPGTGNITEKLSEKAEKVYAVENDTTLATYLEDEYRGTKVEIINDNFLQYEITEEVERCVSNLPFKISSETIEKLGKAQIQSALILQKQLAEKAVADPGESNYGPLTVLANYYFIPVKLRNVAARNYHPKPDVETAILKLYPNKDRHGVENEEWFFKCTRALFTHKRKKVRNAFVDARHIFDIEKDEAKALRDKVPFAEERVVNLDIIKFAQISEFLAEKLEK
jgi:16S rRNA (adenine1518-N6/adenine1519-N6)-dimethyltransferase